MRVPIAIVLLYLPFSACQCIDVLHNEKQCMRGRGPFNTTKTVLGCMEQCLSLNSDRCSYLQWNVKTRDCLLFPRKHHLSKIGDCVTIKKIVCDLIYDSVCFESTSNYVYAGKDELTGLTQEEECRTLCMFMESCQAYTWFAMTSRCRVHQTTMQSGEKLRTGDTQATKLNTCSTGRCVTLRASTFSYEGHKEGLTSLGECMTSSLNTTTVGKVDWNFDDDSCWSHTNRNSEAIAFDVVQIIQLVKAYHCQMIQRGMCMKKRKHVGMSGGYKISNVYEEDCVSLCYVVANCAAVEPDWNGCMFHFVKEDIQQKQGHTLYVAHDCSIDQAESTSIPTTSLTTSSTTSSTTTQTTKSTDGRQNAEGTFRWSYYTRHTGHTVRTMRRSCLECAVLCHRINCTGFTCEEHINGECCKVNVKGEPMFSRALLDHELVGF
ncbi:uncharacterized protein [Haliotis asinina]|uniref:uncharacterized protein n=1 Tax=Haliotis asinina TaxID=109174 RepID=UPI003531F32B